MNLAVAVVGFRDYLVHGAKPFCMPEYLVVLGETEQEAEDRVRLVEKRHGITKQAKLGLEHSIRRINSEMNHSPAATVRRCPLMNGCLRTGRIVHTPHGTKAVWKWLALSEEVKKSLEEERKKQNLHSQ